MARRRVAARENHERWLVSYADFITLLFAFFVVMFATAQKDKEKQKMVAEAVREAMAHDQISEVISGMLSYKRRPAGARADQRGLRLPPQVQATPATRAELEKSAAILRQVLAPELESGKISIELDARGLVISLREAAFFASGGDAVSTASFPILEKISTGIRTIPNTVRLEGHTDSVPIHTPRFRSNWELSAARSISMLELLRQRYAIPAERMSVAGFADNAPVDTNETEEGRGHNRRVDLVVLSAEAMKGEPAAAPEAAARADK